MSRALPRLPFEEEPAAELPSGAPLEAALETPDRAARVRAVDPRFNVALEASAGTGKTRVLVDRYINLLRAGVDPANILAMTFTRKAASEMRERIMATLRTAAARGEILPSRWRELRDRTADITISTIDAFCLSLLREFPLEADLDPGFSMADDTEVPRLIDEALDRALRICRAAARTDEHLALVFAQLGERRARAGLTALLGRRIVAPAVLARYLTTAPPGLDVAGAARRGAAGLLGVFDAMRGGLDRFLETGPLDPAFELLARNLRALHDAVEREGPLDPAAVQAVFVRVRDHFLTQDGTPRSRSPYAKPVFANAADWQAHRDLVVGHAADIARSSAAYRRELNLLVSRGIQRMFLIAESEYRRTLEAHAVLDFSDLLLRALDLLRRMEEFAQSRYRLESRYHHVLVDEFQDTSRAQWELVSLLVRSWGEGAGLAHSGPLQPSIFIVGDRKQSIYGFRDADVSVLREAARHIEALRPDRDVRRSISHSFRAAPALLSFVNDVCHDIGKAPARHDAFLYEESDRFPVASGPPGAGALGLVPAETPEACAEATAGEIARLLAEGETVRDRDTGLARPVRPGDIAILFRTRDSHREFEAALERRAIPAYVYKGLGFFDADEIKDVLALLWYLADPVSDLRAAALLRSRLVGLSDEALRLLAPRLAEALRAAAPPDALAALGGEDARALLEARASTTRWSGLVDRLPPAELLDLVLTESAYPCELRGPRFSQARENLKKIRALVRRMQNRGYATLGRIAAHLDRLAVGEEPNAVIDALDAVNLMTVHAAKGLEFPVVFLVNLARGTGNRRDPVRLEADAAGELASVAVGNFQSEADEDAAPKDVEETKRLVYVAITRARDRLYLGSALKEGRLQPGRGSLAEVLPAALLELFSAAGEHEATRAWRASSGTTHAFVVAGREAPSAGSAGDGEAGAMAGRAGAAGRGDDFEALVDASVARTTVAAAVFGRPGAAGRLSGGRDSDRLAGTLVHRLMQRFGLDAGAVTAETASRVLRPDEADEGAVATAVACFHAICGRADVRALYAAGEPLHEVPFTMHVEGSWLRGTIDCVIRTGRGVTLMEFKTGRPRPEHERQLALYRQAAERLFPGEPVDARLIYADEAPPV